MRKHAFTLIELLVAISIIAIMLALLLPQLTRTRNIARQALCASNLRQTGIGVHVYMLDNRDWVPRIAATINEVTTPRRQTVSSPILASTATEEVESLFPDSTRFCPSYGITTPQSPHRWSYVSPLMSSNQNGQLWTNYVLWHRTTPDDAYVLFKDTVLRNADGTDYKFYLNNRTINPLRSFPLMVDMLQTNAAGTPRRAAPHNSSGNAYSTDVRNIDSEGSNHLWFEGSVEWKTWPDSKRSGGYPTIDSTVRQYPHERASGWATEGWSFSGNNYYVQFYWIKNSR
jgi:prepilin-type N-terminal cleavage/methylation domain-containing protein